MYSEGCQDKENVLMFRTNAGAWAVLRTVPPPLDGVELECLEVLSPDN